jgi:hypothetical protein
MNAARSAGSDRPSQAGHYAADVESLQAYAPPDPALERTDELIDALVPADVLPDR